jgi:hypothetical protein
MVLLPRKADAGIIIKEDNLCQQTHAMTNTAGSGIIKSFRCLIRERQIFTSKLFKED